MPSDVCDYRRSFLAFTTPGGTNTARIQIDARCRVSIDGKTVREYVLITPCRSENTHADTDLLIHPNYEFTGIFEYQSSGDDAEYLLRRSFVDHDPSRVGEWEAGLIRERFDAVRVTIGTCDNVLTLHAPEDVVEMTHMNRSLVARTGIHRSDGHAFEVEYPVKTINVVDNRFQVDTGPIMVPSWLRSGADPVPRGTRAVEQFDEAFVVYNTFNAAEFVLRGPTPVGDGSARTWHYSEIEVTEARNELFAAME